MPFIGLKNIGHLNIIGEKVVNGFMPYILRFINGEKLRDVYYFDPANDPAKCADFLFNKKTDAVYQLRANGLYLQGAAP